MSCSEQFTLFPWSVTCQVKRAKGRGSSSEDQATTMSENWNILKGRGDYKKILSIVLIFFY